MSDVLDNAVKELLDRSCPGPGVTVTNCVVHMDRDLTDRPADCHLCHADVSNTLRRAISVNEWLNDWRADVLDLLRSLPSA